MDGIVKRLFTFDKLIATGLIKFIYWIGLIFIAIGTLITMFAGFSQGFMPGLGGLIFGPIMGVVALLFWRFICEIYLVIFGIYDRLGNIQEAVGGGAAKDISSISDGAPAGPQG